MKWVPYKNYAKQPKTILFHWKKVFLPQSAFNNHDKNAQISQFHSIPSNTNKTLSDLSSVKLLSCVQLFETPWTAAHQASLCIPNSQSLLKLMSIELMMPSNHLNLCCPLLLPPSIFLSIRVFSNESILYITWPKYWSFSFNISPSNEYLGLISFRIDWLDLLSV